MRRQVVIAVSVFAVAFAGIGLLRSRSGVHPPYPERDALPAALRDPAVRGELAAAGWTEGRVIPLDATHWRITFFDGPRYVLDAAVDPHGRVDAVEDHAAGVHPPGARALWNPVLLLLLAAVFVIAVAVRPLRSARNLDAVVVAGACSASALLLDDRLVAAHVYVGAAGLLYVAARCAAAGFLTSPELRHEPVSLGRLLRPIAAAAIAAAVVMTVTSTGASDVAYAGMAGATLLNHGILPYGHLTTDVVHGDTYPLLSYVLYMPLAALTPVHDNFDSLDAALWLNAAALLVVALLVRRWGTRTALAWIAFPPVLLAASEGGNDVPAAVFVAAALVLAARTQLTAGLLTLAGWVKIVPAAGLVPLLGRARDGELVRALALVAVLLAAGIAALLAFGGTSALDSAVNALRFQLERGSWFSVWGQLGIPALQVAFQAATVAFAVAAFAFARRHPDLPLQRLAGLAGAIVALAQLGANYWTYRYLPWLLPFILVALFPPARRRSQPPAPLAP